MRRVAHTAGLHAGWNKWLSRKLSGFRLTGQHPTAQLFSGVKEDEREAPPREPTERAYKITQSPRPDMRSGLSNLDR